MDFGEKLYKRTCSKMSVKISVLVMALDTVLVCIIRFIPRPTISSFSYHCKAIVSSTYLVIQCPRGWGCWCPPYTLPAQPGPASHSAGRYRDSRPLTSHSSAVVYVMSCSLMNCCTTQSHLYNKNIQKYFSSPSVLLKPDTLQHRIK